ncbi:unnamed protein product, partial [Symbiodinium microadriaticum]
GCRVPLWLRLQYNRIADEEDFTLIRCFPIHDEDDDESEGSDLQLEVNCVSNVATLFRLIDEDPEEAAGTTSELRYLHNRRLQKHCWRCSMAKSLTQLRCLLLHGQVETALVAE